MPPWIQVRFTLTRPFEIKDSNFVGLENSILQASRLKARKNIHTNVKHCFCSTIKLLLLSLLCLFFTSFCTPYI